VTRRRADRVDDHPPHVVLLAYSFVRDFEPEPESELCVDRHYLLCVSKGVLRLRADDTEWVLPPARAALIAARRPISVTIPQPATTSSVLFSVESVPTPPEPLVVFDLSPLARALVSECSQWGESDEPLPEYASVMFGALAAATWALASRPSPAAMKIGRSEPLRRALALTDRHLAANPRLEDIAAEVGYSTRALARRFEEELGMTWRSAVRRMRVLRAIEALAGSDAPVTQIAFAIGYSSLSAFNAAFREMTGQTPSEYRRSFQA